MNQRSAQPHPPHLLALARPLDVILGVVLSFNQLYPQKQKISVISVFRVEWPTELCLSLT